MESGKILRVASVAAVGVGLTSLIKYLSTEDKHHEQITSVKDLADEVEQQSKKTRLPTSMTHKASQWGQLLIKDIPENDGLLTQLRMMSQLTAEFEKIPNIIIDNQLRDAQTIPNPLIQSKTKHMKNEAYLNPQAVTLPGTFVLNNARVFTGEMLYYSKKWLIAGVRSTCFFRPYNVRAAIVTCGGLVPGINTLIKELVVCLKENYKVPTVYGIKYSFKGFFAKEYLELNSKSVDTIHHNGGSYLGFSRSMVNPQDIVNKLVEKGINHLYIIGGQGSLKACDLIYKQIKLRKLPIAICTIPKSITNDIPIIDRSFGFSTAIEQTAKAINCAYVQAHSHQNGVGLVKVMGKHTGFMAVRSCIAARNVQVCLIPEFPFDLGGEQGVLRLIEERVSRQKCSVIVFSEGCNKSIRDHNLKVIDHQWDGEPIKEDVGLLIKRQIKGYFAKKGITMTIKYIDPSYMVRDVPANAFDTKLCCQIAQASIDGLMCGYTGFACGHVSNKCVMIPVNEILSGNYSNRMVRHSEEWVRLLATTGQPRFMNDS